MLFYLHHVHSEGYFTLFYSICIKYSYLKRELNIEVCGKGKAEYVLSAFPSAEHQNVPCTHTPPKLEYFVLQVCKKIYFVYSLEKLSVEQSGQVVVNGQLITMP